MQSLKDLKEDIINRLRICACGIYYRYDTNPYANEETYKHLIRETLLNTSIKDAIFYLEVFDPDFDLNDLIEEDWAIRKRNKDDTTYYINERGK